MVSPSDYVEYIARISMGKDSLKMLNVIITRGLPLDRVTTTDVWATDTIRAELPDVLEAKERIEEKLWQMYRITVDHLCARNKDGTKRTYEQMFYHIPNRRSQSVQVERERDGLRPGSIRGFPDLWNKWCQSDLKRCARLQSAGINHWIPTQHKIQLVPEAQNLWGKQSRDFHYQEKAMGSSGVRISKLKQNLSFLNALPRGAGKERSWNTSALQLMSRTALVS